MSVWNRTRGAKTRGGGNFAQNPGTYVMELVRNRAFETRKKHPCRAIEMKVVESEGPAVEVQFKGQKAPKLVEPHKPGSQVTYLITWRGDDFDDYSDGDYKAFICAALKMDGDDYDNLDDETMEALQEIVEGGKGDKQGVGLIDDNDGKPVLFGLKIWTKRVQADTHENAKVQFFKLDDEDDEDDEDE